MINHALEQRRHQGKISVVIIDGVEQPSESADRDFARHDGTTATNPRLTITEKPMEPGLPKHI